jgi:hypothetical protein
MWTDPQHEDYNAKFDPTKGYAAVPNYDSWTFFDDYWGREEWKEWYNSLKQAGSAKDAQEHWKKAWASYREPFSHQGNTEGTSRSLTPRESDWPVFYSDFRNWMKSNNLWVEQNLVSSVITTASSVTDTALDTVQNTAEGAGNTIQFVGKNLPIILGVAGIIGLAYAYRTFKG